MKETIKIGNKIIGNDKPTFIIAEIGTNHNQRKDKAKKLIDIAAKSNVDAVKFQIYHPQDIVSEEIKVDDYGLSDIYNETYWYNVLENHLKTPVEWFPDLSDYAHSLGLNVIATVHCEECMNNMMPYIDAFKIASMDLTHHFLLEKLSLTDMPIILSTGMSKTNEIDEAVNLIRKNNNQLSVLHCVSNYPANFEELNLNFIKTLKTMYSFPIGFSDHALDTLSSIIAVSLGANIIEKHITLNRNDQGPDHKFALEPENLNKLVKNIRKVELSLGTYERNISKKEMKKRELYRRSIIAKTDIKKGETITLDNIKFTRPGTGLLPKYYHLILDKVAIKDIKSESLINFNMISGVTNEGN